MKVWILQIRESGGEDQIYLFDTREKAEQFAKRILWNFAERTVENPEDIPYTLEKLGDMVECNDWGYYDIYLSHVK